MNADKRIETKARNYGRLADQHIHILSVFLEMSAEPPYCVKGVHAAINDG